MTVIQAMTKKRVYVSSTYMDLVEHRAAVKATLERAQFDVECMEKYPAFDERPQDKCLEDVAQCDCLLILDGVDEVPETLGPHRPPRNLLSGLADALPEWLKAGNRNIAHQPSLRSGRCRPPQPQSAAGRTGGVTPTTARNIHSSLVCRRRPAACRGKGQWPDRPSRRTPRSRRTTRQPNVVDRAVRQVRRGLVPAAGLLPALRQRGQSDSGGDPRVLRGGSWFSAPLWLRPATRLRDDLRYRYYDWGFRLSRTLTI